MLTIKVVFWISLGIIFYTYIGYGLIISLVNCINRLFRHDEPIEMEYFEPTVTLVVAAYNEEDCIHQKIENCLELDYPDEKLDIIFITDGSTDSSYNIISKYSRVRLLHLPERRGKSAALNRAMRYVDTTLVIFCDANTILGRDSIKMIVKHYSDPRIGGVSGEKRVLKQSDNDPAGEGEGFYWKYESWLKRMDSGFYSVVGAAGELFSLRTSLYSPIDDSVILDDFVISMNVALLGYRVVYEPLAYASEMPSENIREEQKRKVRISAGGFQAMVLLKEVFNIFKFPILGFQFISHRVLRWTIAPICLLLIFVLSGIVSLEANDFWFSIFFLGQILFYVFAWLGHFFSKKRRMVKVFYIPYYFVFMNIAVVLGFWRFYRGAQSVLWEKARRVT